MESKQAVIILDKKRGETPLECLKRFKKDNPQYEKEKMTYAGRLDPMASGLLLLLAGDECKNKEKYLNLEKEYEVDLLFGFSTDTYDILGVVTDSSDKVLPDIEKVAQSFVGKFSQKYPLFSSKTVSGIPLFVYARNKILGLDKIPTKDVEIKEINFLGNRTISKQDLYDFVKSSISMVSGDFRQNKIIKSWDKNIKNNKNDKFDIFSIKVSCSSGTYMRSLANEIGLKVDIPALALNIRRVKLGDYKLTK